MTNRAESILHSLKLLMEVISDYQLLNAKDGDNYTILHLAVADKQIEHHWCWKFVHLQLNDHQVQARLCSETCKQTNIRCDTPTPHCFEENHANSHKWAFFFTSAAKSISPRTKPKNDKCKEHGDARNSKSKTPIKIVLNVVQN